jgi:hypothetical protein
MKKLPLMPKTMRLDVGAAALIVAGGIVTAGCTPKEVDTTPTASGIFDPNPNYNFAADNGSVSITGLSGQTVCYTVDGSTPSYNEGTCSGGTTESLSGGSGSIALECGSDTASSVIRTINVTFSWEGAVVNRSGNFLLDCTPPPADTDEDGVIDDEDNCPYDANADQTDSDGNGIGDACQDDSAPDADGDGRPDETDNCVNVWNVNQGDADGDGIGNVCDDTPDGEPVLAWANLSMLQDWIKTEGELRCMMNDSRTGNSDCEEWDELSAPPTMTVSCENGGSVVWETEVCGFAGCPTFTYSNCQHTNADGVTMIVDGVYTGTFNASKSSTDATADFTITGSDWTGMIYDRVDIEGGLKGAGYYEVSCSTDPLADEVCASNNTVVRFNAPSWDCDGGICPEPTPALADTDGDGVVDKYDNCPNDANADQANADFDSEGDVCDSSTDVDDADSDGVIDNADNCPNDANADQADADNDGIGDVCDPQPNFADADDDGIEDSADNCPNTANPNQEDMNSDGQGDACDDSDNDTVLDDVDNCPNDANTDQADADGNGVGDVCDAPSYFLAKVMNDGGCLQANSSNELYTVSCNASDTAQQWEIIDLGSGVYAFRNIGKDACMEAYTSWAVPYTRVASCDTGSSDQQWELRMDGDDSTYYPYQLDNVDVNYCVWRNDSDRASGTLGNCGLISLDRRSFGFYPEGDFSGVPFTP